MKKTSYGLYYKKKRKRLEVKSFIIFRLYDNIKKSLFTKKNEN